MGDPLLCSDSNRITVQCNLSGSDVDLKRLYSDLSSDKGYISNKDRVNLIKNAFIEHDINKALDLTADYVIDLGNKGILLRDKETDKVIFLAYKTRFSDVYVREIKDKFKKLRGFAGDLGHFTITMPFSDNPYEAFKLLKSQIRFFIVQLRRLMRCEYDYIYTTEITANENGLLHIHIHLLVFGSSYISKEILDKLRFWWFNKTAGEYIYYKYVKGYSNSRFLFWYVMKYVFKEVIDINLTSSFLFSCRGRSYACSRCLLSLGLKNKSNFELVGCGFYYAVLNGLTADKIVNIEELRALYSDLDYWLKKGASGASDIEGGFYPYVDCDNIHKIEKNV